MKTPKSNAARTPDSGTPISRADFLKRSSLSLGALFVGLNAEAAAKSLKGQASPSVSKFRWGAGWQPERPQRLSPITRQLAELGLSGAHGRNLVKADWDFPEKNDPTLSPDRRYAYAARSVAEHAPVRILPGELIVGAATLYESTCHAVPLLNCNSVSHTTIGFGKVLQSGYAGLRREIDERLRRGGLDEKGRDLLESMRLTLEAAGVWQQRNIAELERQKAALPAAERPFVQTLIDTLQRVPEEAPRNFREAVQSLWSMYAFQRIMGTWSGIGRIDQMLGPYLERDLKNGTLTLSDAREILAHFWIKGCEWIGYNGPTGDAQFYQNIILGGIDRNGDEVTNPVTYLVLDIVEELHISDFPVAVRLGRKTPEKLFRRMAEVQRFGGGIVSMYSEDTVIDGLMKFGYPPEEAREFTNDGCWEAIIPGKTAFSYSPSDMLQPLFRTLNLNSPEAPLPDYPDFASLYEAFERELRIDVGWVQESIDDMYRGEWPNPLASMFVEGCIEKGRGYYDKGPKYSVQGIHYGGVSDTANSLLVLKKLVYDEKYVSLPEFAQMLRDNWEGNEPMRKLVQNRFRFYGNNDAEADALMRRVFDSYTAIAGECKERNGVKRPCGISTFGREIDWRMKRRATPEGSRIGDILATNCSPTPGSDRKGPTAAIQSYCKLDFSQACNGATLELKILPSSVKGENGIAALTGLAKSFRKLGGFYLHVDVVDSATLLDAQRHPDRYPNLPVRVAGWSARFNTLCKEWQDMIIQRTQQLA